MMEFFFTCQRDDKRKHPDLLYHPAHVRHLFRREPPNWLFLPTVAAEKSLGMLFAARKTEEIKNNP